MKKTMRFLALAAAAASLAAVVRADDDGGGGESKSPRPARAGRRRGGDAANGAALFSADCAACHGADASGGIGPNVQGRSAGAVLEAMREGEDGMPRFPFLGAREARDLAAFLRDPSAAAPPPAPTPTLSAPTWSGGVGALITQNCASCHRGASAPKGVRLDNLARVRTNAAAALAAMEAGRMPPAGPLAAADVQAVRDWIAAGTPK